MDIVSLWYSFQICFQLRFILFMARLTSILKPPQCDNRFSVEMGQILELKGREQTGGALRALLDLSPKTARRIKGQTESEIPLDEIQIDDELRYVQEKKSPLMA